MSDDCLFCKIAAGAIPSEKVYENDRVFAFLDINPINPGHTLVVPKAHAENIYGISAEDFGAVMEAVRMLSSRIKSAVGADGINIGMNNGGAAGQLVFHAHVHVIPRHSSDGFTHWHGKGYGEGEMEATGEQIRKKLSEYEKLS